LDIGQFLELHFASGHDHSLSAHSNLFHGTCGAGYFKVNAARALDEVALFDHEFVFPVDRFDSGGAMMDQIGAQRTAGAAGCGIFRDIVSRRKKSRMRPRLLEPVSGFRCMRPGGMVPGSR